MPKGFFIQNSFNGGQWSPVLAGRTDLDSGTSIYKNAVSMLENFILWPHGAAQNRPGFRFIYATKTSSTRSRLIPFEFSVTQAYQLEFGDSYIRFYKDQGIILSGGIPYEISSPYLAADVDEIKYFQSADVLYLCHKDYPTMKLSRESDTSWTLQEITFRPGAIGEQGIKPATTLTLGAVSGTSITFTAGASAFLSGDVGRLITYGVGRASIVSFLSTTEVTCDIVDTFSGVGPFASQLWSIIGSPNGELTSDKKDPKGVICILTSSGEAETFTNLLNTTGGNWSLSGGGTTEYYLLDLAPFYSAAKPSRVYINDVEIAEGTLGSLGIIQWGFGDNDTLGYDTVYIRLSDGTDPDSKSTVVAPDNDFIQRSTVTSAPDVFRSTDIGKYVRLSSGLVKISSFTSATSVKGEIIKELSTLTTTTAWTLESDSWNGTDGYPSCGTFHDERLILVRDETIWGSQVGDYENFTPGIDDGDAIERTLGARQINAIRWINSQNGLVVGTAGAEWKITAGGIGEPLTPTNMTATLQSSNGSYDTLPIEAGSSLLFVSNSGKKLREFTYNWESAGYVAPDLLMLAEDLTTEDPISGIVLQREPLPTVWAFTSAGNLLGLTYLRDASVIGWHKHPMTNGTVESISVIPGDGYDELWAIINRTIGGATVRYVEMMEKIFTDSTTTYNTNLGANAFFVDSGVTKTGSSSTITGLSHLEGQTVAILADGSVHPNQVVSGGSVTLSKAASIRHAGLPYTSTLQTMRIDAALNDGTIQGRQKRILEAIVRVLKSGTFKVGRSSSNLDTVFDRERVLVPGDPYPLYTGDIRSGFDDEWGEEAQIMIVQDKPMPLTILAVIAATNIS